MFSNTVDSVQKDEKGRFRVPPRVGPKSVNKWMVEELSSKWPEGLPQNFWDRVVRVVNEEREAKNMWESEEKGKVAKEDVLQKSWERLEKLSKYWKNGKFTNEKWTHNFISVRRPPPPNWMKKVPNWTKPALFDNVRDSVTQKFYVWRESRPEASNKRYFQALESGEMHHEFFETLRRKERKLRKEKDEGKTPSPCRKCGFSHWVDEDCPKFAAHEAQFHIE
ncbi:hypothetical protein HYALB_00013675 [Hymenoscyphus albidus]|uniref:Uncharacterized protein n=1 Tax=Hymenoscyphus albidus TaxID=595503 RepID=A0A9N9LV75_9HELO|nr:hypothetical protein HYALB_00013675 [Hymenoscyphus albidus]